MDDEVASLYRSAKAVTHDAVAFKRETNEEWRSRESCGDRDCLVAWYQRRSAQLAAEINHGQAAELRSEPTAAVPQPVKADALVADDSFPVGTTIWVVAGIVGFLWVRAKVIKGKRIIAAQQARRDEMAESELTVARKSETRTPDRTRETASGVSRRRTGASSKPRTPTIWIPPGESVVVHGATIPGGMLYVGSSLMAADGGVEPAQLDPTLEMDAGPATPDERHFGYWPRYHEISPIARRAYLTWLSGGRRDPAADIGYVFLFFYGLERRALVEAAADEAAQAEIPAIVDEIERLRAIYDNNSFLRYSSDLIDFLAAGAVARGCYLKAPPPDTSNRGMSLRLKVGLGQCAVDGAPVPVGWALAWARSEANVHLPRSASRCARQFDSQFKAQYAQHFNEGLKLGVNRTKLKIAYRAASSGLLGQGFTADLGALPDVTTVVAPLKKLQSVVDTAAAGLEAYSRFIGRHADRVASLEATLLLPKALWPVSVQDAVAGLDKRIGAGMVVIKLGELLTVFGGTSTLTRETLKNLFQVLQSAQVGVEPNVLAGAKTPKADDSVVLFRLEGDDGVAGHHNAAGYEASAVMLDLAITLANADGKISGREVQFLNRQVDAWAHVGDSAQRRLRARLRLGIVYPPSLASLRSKIEPLPAEAKVGLGKLLSALALADGTLAPAAVKHLEKVYGLLGIEASALYRELHVASAASDRQARGVTASRLVERSAPEPVKGLSATVPSLHVPKRAQALGGFQLDPARVAALQVESERVTAMLSKVFEDQESMASVATVPLPSPALDDTEAESHGRESRLLGLDPEHSAFLRVLLTRPSWSRAELGEVAADMELMLDGALERVNEATLDTLDNRIAEGDDPIEIDQDLMENASAWT
jgi:uncharacterized tellurite resistance protein B-like protein